MKLVLTGSAGHFGGWMRRLKPRGVELLSIDIRDSDPIDILSPRAQAMVAEADCVVHAAALIDVVASIRDPGPTLRTNVDGTRNLLEGLRPGAHFVFVSSAAVYGHATRVPVGEDEPPKPLSPYGESKVTGEHLTQEIAKRRGASWTVVRPFNMYSETQETTNAYTGAIWKFVQAARAGAPLRIHGDGLQTRDFIHASDVARLLWACVIEERARSVTMNAGTGQGMKVLDLARTIVRLCGSRSPIIHADAIAGEVRHSVARCDVARSLGWTPTVGLEEGLQRVLARPDLPT